jgi:hypothetical protein
MCDKDAGFGRIVNSVRRVDKLTHLQESCPHSTLTTSNGSAAFAIIKKLMHDNSTTKTK